MDSDIEVSALAINVTIPEPLRWTDTRRGEEFLLTTLNIRLLPDGHLGWRGKQAVDYGGRPYTKKQIGFFVSRGQMPYGCVRRMCDVEECVLPEHISDQVERQALKVAAERAEAARLTEAAA